MAPWPEPENEPKAPDKTVSAPAAKQCHNSTEKIKHASFDDSDSSGAAKHGEEQNSSVSGLDDIQLRKLLDEAFTYKRPKDREGKSELFRNLLQEVEADESERSGGQHAGSVSGAVGGRYRRGAGGAGRKGDVSERNSRGGSLQNLVYALNFDPDVHAGLGLGRKRTGRRNLQAQGSVSARQREGGSLPCNVNADYHTAAALLPSADKRRDSQTTPIDDIVTGNSYSYKLNADKCRSGAADDLSGYRVSGTSKRAIGTVDDIGIAAARSSASKRDELKKLGRSSDDLYTGTDSASCVNEEFKRKTEYLLDDIKNDNIATSDVDVEYRRRLQNNVDSGSSDHTVIDIELKGLRPGAPMVGVGMNGSIRAGTDRLWTKSDNRKDEEIDTYKKFATMKSSEQNGMEEVDRPIEFRLGNSRSLTNGDRLLQLSGAQHFENIVGRPAQELVAESARSLEDPLGDSRFSLDKSPRYAIGQLSPWKAETDMHFVRVGDPRNEFRNLFATSKDSLDKKSYDENGNALHQLHSASERKRLRNKTKIDNNPCVLAEQIPGHRGDIEDIEELIQYIESDSPDAKSSLGGKNNRSANGPVSFAKDSKHRNNNGNGSQKLRSEKRKSSEKNKLHKSNSLEEISRTKLSDLTGTDNAGASSKGVERRAKKQATLDDGDLAGSGGESNRKTPGSGRSGADRRSWGHEESLDADDEEVLSRSRKRKGTEREQNRNRERGGGSGGGSVSRKKTDSTPQQRRSAPPSESCDQSLSQSSDVASSDATEFHVVTKKQRRKKTTGRSSSSGRTERNQHHSQHYYSRDGPGRRGHCVDSNENHLLYQYRPCRVDSPGHGQHHRRKSTSSMPPSDKSADSSDLDSVHSLPISSTTPRATLDKTSTSSGSTPQASYADITRMAAAAAAAAMSPPQGATSASSLSCSSTPTGSAQQGLGPAPALDHIQLPIQGVPSSKNPVATSLPQPPLWTANVTHQAAVPLPTSQEDSPPPSAVSSGSLATASNLTKRDAMTNTVDNKPLDKSPVGNLLSDNCYPPLRESGKSPMALTQCVKTFISQVSRTTPTVSHGVTMANCVDVEDSVKRAVSPSFDSVRESARTSCSDRPPVIILDDEETETRVDGDPELTFGFEINEMLLSGACGLSSEEEEESNPNSTQVLCKPQSSFTAIPSINLDKIVAYVEQAWKDVIKELPCEAGASSRVQYYCGQ